MVAKTLITIVSMDDGYPCFSIYSYVNTSELLLLLDSFTHET